MKRRGFQLIIALLVFSGINAQTPEKEQTEALGKAQELATQQLSALTGGLKIPGM